MKPKRRLPRGLVVSVLRAPTYARVPPVTARRLGRLERGLETAGLVHPSPEAVSASLFQGPEPFFLAADKVQVKYEMLRAHIVDGQAVAACARSHGYSRASFYLVAGAFAERGMTGLLDERPGRRGPLKLTPEIVAFLQAGAPGISGAELAGEVERRFGVSLHRRTIERAQRR